MLIMLPMNEIGSFFPPYTRAAAAQRLKITACCIVFHRKVTLGTISKNSAVLTFSSVDQMMSEKRAQNSEFIPSWEHQRIVGGFKEQTMTSSGHSSDCTVFHSTLPPPELASAAKPAVGLHRSAAVRQLDCPHQASLVICWCKMASGLGASGTVNELWRF